MALYFQERLFDTVDVSIVVQFAIATLMPVVATALLWLLHKRVTAVSQLPRMAWQVIVGIVFGAIAIYGTEMGIPYEGATMNVRDAAPVAAGLLFGGPAGIIAAVIGGVERWIAVAWGVGEFTRVACSLGTILAGIYAAFLRKFMFDDRVPSWPMALATGTVVEVLHLLLVFATNLDEASRALTVVQACALPMVGCVSASVALSTVTVILLSSRRAFVPRQERGVAQIVQGRLLVAVVTAFFITVGFTYLVQANLARSDARALLTLNITDVKQDIADASDEKLLEFARRAAAVVRAPSGATNEECSRLAGEMGLAEVNVVDKRGIIVASNVGELVGFNMASGEMAAEFLALLPGGGATELAQSLRPMATDPNVWRKYAGVAIQDGFVQVGYDDVALAEDFVEQLKTSVRNRHIGQTGGLGVVDKDRNVISAGGDAASQPGDTLAADAPVAGEGNLFITTFNGKECYSMFQGVEGYNVVAVLPTEEANASRDAATLITSLMEVLIFAALFTVMYFVIKRVVVRSIWQVNGRLGEITRGDLDVEVDVRESSEFSTLSDDINQTVGALKDSLAAVQSDLDMAAEIQANTLPAMTPDIANHGNFRLHASMEPAKEVGGDFYDVFWVDDDHLALVVADVSGKGVPAALFMMLSKTVIKMEALSGLSPEKVLQRANVDLSEKNDDDMFTTAWLGILEVSTGKLVYADAGHEKLALFRGGVWELPPKPNSAVALASFNREDYDELPDKYHFRTHMVQLQPGDAIFQYTDGVTEATDEHDELFGEERLLQALNDAPGCDPQTVLPFVRVRIGEFVGDAPQFDDITMLGLSYAGAGSVRVQ